MRHNYLKSLLGMLMIMVGMSAWADTMTITWSEIASANSWENGIAQNNVVISPFTFTVSGGGNNGKYYTSDTTWRFYSGGGLSISAADGYTITAVTSNPSQTFAVSKDGVASTSFTATVKFKSITIDYSTKEGGDTPATPTVAAPTFSLAEGTYYGTQTIKLTTALEDATIYYTTDESDPTESTTAIEYTGAITLSATTTVKAVVMDADANFSDVVTKTYTIVPSIANTAETAYTTAEAIALIKATSTDQLKAEKVYVKGTVSKVDKFTEKYGSIQYWLDGDSFEVYGGLGLNNNKFTNINDVVVGADVIIYGYITSFGTSPVVYEFAKDNYLVSYEAPSTGKLTPTIVATYSTSLTAGGAPEIFAVSYDGDGALSVASSATSVATASLEGSNVTVTPIAEGTTIITITAAETEAYNAASKSYTLNVVAPVEPATLPFAFDGGVADIEKTTGMSQNGLGTDYSNSPKLKFDGTGDHVVICYAEAAKKLNYTIKGNSFSDGTFDVLESADGIDYTGVKSYTTLGAAASESYSLKDDTRYVKFIYTKKGNGNVALGAIEITDEDIPEITITGNSILVAQAGTEEAPRYFAMTTTKNGKYMESAEIYKYDDTYLVSAKMDDILYYTETTDNQTTIQNPADATYFQATAAGTVGFAKESYAWTNYGDSLKAADPDHGFLRYNAINPRFTTYTTTFGQDVTIVPSESILKGYVRNGLEAGKMGTICLDRDVESADITGATFYTIAGKRLNENEEPKSVVFEEAVNGLEAGVPYIFIADEAEIIALFDGDATTTEAQTVNGLVGTLEDGVIAEGMYALTGNTITKCGEKVKVYANRAYINMTEVPVFAESEVKGFELSLDGNTTAILNTNANLDTDKVIYNLQGQRVTSAGAALKKGLYIQGGKKRLY